MNPYYQQNGITIYHGDAQAVLPQLEAFGGGLVVTDPPYQPPKTIGTNRDGIARFPRSVADFSLLDFYYRAMFTELSRMIAPSGILYAFCDSTSYPVFWIQALAHARAARALVWDKGRAINGYGWRHQHELVVFAEWPLATSVKTGDGDVIRFPAMPHTQRTHPQEKPVPLLRRFIAKHSGDVLDPFMGSGATGEAAMLEGRGFIGIEIEERYCELAAKRLSQGVFEFNGSHEDTQSLQD